MAHEPVELSGKLVDKTLCQTYLVPSLYMTYHQIETIFRYYCLHGMTYVDKNGVETPGYEVTCQWDDTWTTGTIPGTCECKYRF